MSAFDQVDIGTNPDDMTGDPARTAFTKANDNTAKTANITEENTFLKKQTIKAATNDGSKAFIILDSTGAEVASISDTGVFVGATTPVAGDIIHVIEPIGIWNMDLTASIDVNYTVPTGYSLIGYEVFISSDGEDSELNPLTLGGSIESVLSVDGYFTLSRIVSGHFDNANYNDGAINRGHILIHLQKN